MTDRTFTEEEQAIVSGLEAQHGEVKSYRLKDGRFVVVRACNPIERVQMVDAVNARGKDAASKLASAHSSLATSAIVYPTDRAEAIAILRRFPALNDKFAQDSYELAEGGIVELGNG